MNASNLLMPIGYAYSPIRECEIRRVPARNPDTYMEVSDLYLYIYIYIYIYTYIKKEMLLHSVCLISE